MSSTLFRSEVLVAQRQRLWGEVRIATPVASRVLTLLLLLCVVACTAFLASGTYARKETVRGYLRAGGGVVKVTVPAPGIVDDVAVQAGSRVRAGDALLRLRQPRVLADGRDGVAAVSAVLAAEQQRAAAQLRDERARAALDAGLLAARVTQLQAEAHAAAAELARRERALALAHAQQASLARLSAAGHAARVQVDAAAAQAIDAEQAVADVRARIDSLAAARAQLAIEQRRAPLEANARIAAIERVASDLATRRVDTELGAGQVVIAPVDGVVADVYVHAGAHVDGSRPLLALAPDGRLEAVLLVPSRAAGFVTAGQRVRLRYDAFPHARFGSFAASVSHVDDVLLVPGELPDPVPVNEPVFRVRATPAVEVVHAYGRRLPLRDGLAFDADVVLEDRSLLSLLLDPLLAMRGRI
jgi:membrane fusion protein